MSIVDIIPCATIYSTVIIKPFLYLYQFLRHDFVKIIKGLWQVIVPSTEHGLPSIDICFPLLNSISVLISSSLNYFPTLNNPLVLVSIGTKVNPENFQTIKQKFRIQETKHLSTDADSSTNAIGGWTKNTQKPNFF